MLAQSKLVRTLRLGVKSLLLHKLRSALAVLGILIGVTAVIWLVAMGEGVSYQAQQQIKELGAENILVRSIKPPNDSSGSGGAFLRYGLLRDDFDRVAQIPHVVGAVPIRELTKEVRYADRSADVRLVGCTPEYLSLNRLTMARGSFISARDIDTRDNVCVLAYQTALKLFPYQDPIGSTIQIDSDFYTVIGQTDQRQATGAVGGSFSGQDYNLDVYIPISTLRARIGDQVLSRRTGGFEGEILELSQITVTVDDVENVEQTAEIIEHVLSKYHLGDNPDYGLTVPKELLRQAKVTQMMFNFLLVLIAGIALLVGGIGIMNIMLATVTERTREIGIRRALGAKQRDIVQQFLAETVVLSSTGGLLGVGLGFLCYPAVIYSRQFFGYLAPELIESLPANIVNLEPRIAWWSVFAAFGISVASGVIFGLYPASRAAAMDPIEALRHE